MPEMLRRLLVGAGAGIGVPAGVLAWQTHVVHEHPALAVVLVVAYELALAVLALSARIAGKAIGHRADEFADALDRALGRRLSRYRREYRRFVLGHLRFVDARGLATVGEFTPDLDEVYVDLVLTPRAPHDIPAGVLAGRAARAADDPSAGGPAGRGARSGDEPERRRAIWEFVQRPEPGVLAVLGGPGSGKTTLLRHVARRAAVRRDHPRRPVPLLLELRTHAAAIVAAPDTTLAALIRHDLRALPVAEPPGWWEQQLRSGRCVVLLDGLDEVARPEDRQAVSEWVAGQLARYPGNDYVLTSRPHGYRAAPVPGAEVVHVRPFTAEQTGRFLDAWYLAVERRATGSHAPETERLAHDAAADLLDRLRGVPALAELARNPLLLTMIANVHRYRGALPGSRADLYSEMCQVVLWRRTEAKKLDHAVPPAVGLRLLALLAHTMMQRQVRDLPSAQIAAILGPGLRRAATGLTTEAFLTGLGSNGLLVERERDLYAFAHLTFQEYLAAQHIADHPDLVPTLAAAVEDPWWRETILLFVSGSSAADADPIVRACLDAGTAGPLALAFDCADLSGNLAPELRRRLDDSMAAAFEPGAKSTHIRLIAAVLVHRLREHQVTAPTGTRIGVRPVSAELYRLFQTASGWRPPGAAVPPPGPVLGSSGTDAQRLASWLRESVGRECDLPTADDFANPAVADAIRRRGASAVRAVWLRDGSRHGLGADRPPGLSAAQLVAAIQADVDTSPAAAQVMLSVVRVAYTTGAFGDALRERLPRDLQFAERPLPAGPHALHSTIWIRDRLLARVLGHDADLARTLGLDLDMHHNGRVRGEFARWDAAGQPAEAQPSDITMLDDALTALLGSRLAGARRKKWPLDLTALLTDALPADWRFTLGGSAGEALGLAWHLTDREFDPGEFGRWRRTVCERLGGRVKEIATGRRGLTAADATAIRLAALVLAGEPGVQAEAMWRLAAAVTVLQQQVDGSVPSGDGIVLVFGR